MTDDRWQMTNQMVADSVKNGVDDPMRLPGDDLSFVIWDLSFLLVTARSECCKRRRLLARTGPLLLPVGP